MVELSKAQTAAINSFGADVAVSAAAGSGKTSVLVHRFVQAVVREGVQPGEILAVTFTDKAANSMKERLVKEFLSLGRSQERRLLETAYIGTIHSFCLRLLRENPIEAGIDPYFSVLSEGEADLLMTRALSSVFEAQHDRPEWLSILAERGEERVRRALLDLYTQWRSMGEEEKILSIEDGTSSAKEAARDLLEHLKKGKDLASSSGGSAKPAANQTAALVAALEVPPLLSGPINFKNFLKIRELLEIDRRGARMKEWVVELEELFDRWRGHALQIVYTAKKEEFLRVFRLFSEAYERQKRAQALLDFDDLPQLALRLLSGSSLAQKAVRERYRKQFKHIFIDEFQDTNPLQAALIDLLRGKDNLFVVGDVRQSIYSFRHADPGLFLRYEAAAGKKIPLSENFRSRPAVLEFANQFFSESGFDPLYPAKKFSFPGSGTVETICVDYGKELPVEDLESARMLEADVLASHLRQLVESGARVESQAGDGRPMEWGDIAILFRGTAQAPFYERALARAGIPFYSVKSKGFYERPEVKDFVHFLTLLDRPWEDVSLATVLRSPLVGVSDDGLFWLAQSAKKESKNPQPLASVLEAPEKIKNLSKEDAQKTAKFSDFLESTRLLKNSLKVSDLLERAMLWSHYEAVALTRSGGMQGVANIRKLVESARSLEEKTSFDATEFVRYLRSMAEREEGSAEARVETEGAEAVVLMSIHAAKGLEFPCVVLANLGGKKPGFGPGFVAATVEAGLGWSDPDPDKENKPLQDKAYETAAIQLRRREEEEEDRVFYVGMTRAQERLILSGSRAKSGTWIARVRDFLETGRGKDLQVPILTSVAKAAEFPIQTSVKNFSMETSIEPLISRLDFIPKPYDSALDLTVSEVVAKTAPASDFSAEPESFDPEDAERSPRNEFGTIFHRLMEVSLCRARQGKVLESDHFASLLQGLNENEKDQALEAMKYFWKSSLGEEILRSKRVYPELPFIYKTPHGLLKGQIDLVYQRSDGEWIVVDYKTNRLSPDQVKLKAEEYQMQLGLYALVCRDLLGVAPKKGILHFMSVSQNHEFLYTETEFEVVRERLLSVFQSLA